MTVAENIEVILDLDDKGFRVKMRGADKEMRRFTRSVSRIDRNVQRAERSLGGFTASLRDWTLIIGQARNALHQLWIVFGDIPARIVRSNAEIERMTFLMKGLSDAAGETAQFEDARNIIDEMFRLGKETPFEINALSDSFVKMKSVGIDPLNGSLEAMTDAVAAFGGTNETMKRASIAIQQMAGKGVISMEELRQQMGEAVPRAIELMARATGQTFGQLVEQISKGNVEAKPALAAMFREFQRVYGGDARRLMESFSGQYSRMITNLRELTSQNEGMVDFFEAVKQQLRDLNEFLESPAAQNFATAFGNAMSMVIQFGRAAIDMFLEYRDVIVAAGKALFIYWAANRLAPVLSGMTSLARSIRNQVRLWRTLQSAQFQANLTIVEAGRGFSRITRPVKTATSGLRLFGLAIRGMGRAFLGMLGPLGLAVSGIWTLIEVFDVFGSKHRQILEDILKGQRIASAEEKKQAQEAIEAKKQELAEKRAEAEKYLKWVKNTRVSEAQVDSVLNDENASLAAKDAARNLKRRFDLAREYRREMAKLSREIREQEEAVKDATDAFDEWQASERAEDVLKGVRDAVAEISQQYDQASIEIQENENLSDKERQKQLEEARREYYEQAAAAWKAFIDEQNRALREAVIAGDKEAQASLQVIIANARNALASVFSQMRAAASGDGNLSLVDDDDGGGFGGKKSPLEKARDTFDDVAGDLKSDMADLTRRLARPFGFEIPDSIKKTEDRLREAIVKLKDGSAAAKRFKEEMKGLMAQAREVALGEEILDMREGNRELARDVMGRSQARKAELRDAIEVERQKLEFFKQSGERRVELERLVQERIRLLQEKFFQDTPLGQYLSEWKDFGENIQSFMADTFRGISQQLADMITEGKADLNDFARSILNTFLQISINTAISGLLSGTGLGKILGGVGHSGGIAGSLGTSRRVDPTAFAGAPRFHTGGVVGEEVPIIAKRGEGVFTREQMEAIGKGMSRGPAEVGVNIINETGQPVEGQQGETRFDGEKMVLDVVLTAAGRPGKFRDSMKEALK